MKVAILDDYQNVALKSADWSPVAERAEITVFNDHVSDPFALVERLLPFDVLCVMRERTPLPRSVIQELPQLKMIASTGHGTRRSMRRPRASKELPFPGPGIGQRQRSS
jgi:phosphoglycerate dehydrogenase-like enzyme